MRVALFSPDPVTAARLERDLATLAEVQLKSFTDLRALRDWSEAQDAVAAILVADGAEAVFLDGIAELRKRLAPDRLAILSLIPSSGAVTSAAALTAGSSEVCRLDSHPAELRNRLGVLMDLIGSKSTLWEEREVMCRLSIVDPLTRLMNRPAFLERTDAEIARNRRADKPLVVALLDVDRFKEINERHGRAVGDQVLTMVGDQCRNILRENDLAGRLGGIVFALCLPEVGLSDGASVLNRLRRRLSDFAFPLPRSSLSVTASIGVTALDPDDQDASDLINRADRALLRARESGHDRLERG